jgi:hypothetical protein
VHTLARTGAATLLEQGQRLFVQAKTPVEVQHREHHTITLPEGTFEVRFQREWMGRRERFVVD